MTTISRDHPIARAILAEYPNAVRVFALNRGAGNWDVSLDCADTGPGSEPLFGFSDAAAQVIAASWSPDSPEPWERCGDATSIWFLSIAAAN